MTPSLPDPGGSSPAGYSQQDAAPCPQVQTTSNWFLDHHNELTILQEPPPESPDLSPVELCFPPFLRGES